MIFVTNWFRTPLQGERRRNNVSDKAYEIIDNYLRWLYFDVLDGPERRFKTYNSLFETLLLEPYIPLHHMDRNRFKDALTMRNEYILGDLVGYGGPYESSEECKDCKDEIEDILPECSVLEMLIALAVRMEKEIMAPANGDNDYFRWFWGMICTLELDDFDEKHYDEGWIKKITDDFLRGERYIFRLKGGPEVNDGLQIWDQMNRFLVENY